MESAQFRLTPAQAAFCAQVRTIAETELAPLAAAGTPGRVNRPLLEALGQRGQLARLFPGAGTGNDAAGSDRRLRTGPAMPDLRCRDVDVR